MNTLSDGQATHSTNHCFKKFDWPPVGCLKYLSVWTFGKGATSLEARTQRYGRQAEGPPLSPKSRLVHIALEGPPASPRTVLGRAPIYEFENDEDSEYSDSLDEENIALDYGEDYEPKEMQPSLSQCYSCGSACLDASARPPAGESSHWFLDVHDGVRRKVAYLFCWECVGLFLRQLQRPPHPGCGHLPSLSLPSCAQECQLMFCDRCRVEIGQQVRSPPQGRV